MACFDLARFHHDRGRSRRRVRPLAARPRVAGAHSAVFARTLPRVRRCDHATVRRRRMRAGPRAANADTAPVFIVGMPRSGTSLTEQILAAHRDVCGAGERTAVHRLLIELAGATDSVAGVRTAAGLDRRHPDRSRGDASWRVARRRRRARRSSSTNARQRAASRVHRDIASRRESHPLPTRSARYRTCPSSSTGSSAIILYAHDLADLVGDRPSTSG